MGRYLIFHIIAFSLGMVLDIIVGDPYKLPHPIRLIGRLIGGLDRLFMGPKDMVSTRKGKERVLGIVLGIIVILSTLLICTAVIVGAYYVNVYVGMVIEAILTFYVLAAKSLYTESMKVYKELESGDIEKARYAVSMIVGRDTKVLDEKGVVKAAVETVAENTSDGVIAPMIYTAILGPVGGMVYKSINTMDSMIGYHNDRYEYFGRFAARLDDVVNFFPSRLSAVFMIIGAFILGIKSKVYNGVNAYKIWRRDRYNHKSPNSAQTESVCAGALSLRLAGPASYFGKIVDKPYIGDDIRAISNEDIVNANVLMFITEGICYLICVGVMFVIYFL